MNEKNCHADMIQFWTCLTRGICMGANLQTALQSAFEEIESESARKVIAGVIADVRKGLRLSEAMARHPQFFSKAAVCFVEGGEYAGVLDRVLVLVLETMWRCPTCGCWNLPNPATGES